MNLKNKILYLLSKRTLNRNKRFKGLHAGESCYIFGNGASLKYFDLKQFNDRISIGCSSLFLHRDFQELNLKYYYMGHPFLFYKYWKNQYEKKYQKSLVGALYRKNIQLNPHIEYFMSLSNYFGIRGSNINYVHHFDQLSEDLSKIELDNAFSSMGGALDGMLGLAVYMGFKDITLIGCDYTYKPQSNGHFYEFGRRPDSLNKKIFSELMLCSLMNMANIKTVTIDDTYKGDVVQSVSYEELMRDMPNYKENSDIVLKNNLNELDKLNMHYRIFP